MKNLAVKTLLGFLNLMAAVGLFLFVSAGTFHFWQAWVFLSVLLACSGWITLYFLKHDPKLIESRLQAGPTAEKEKTQKIIQALAGLCFVLSLVVPGLDHRFGWSRIPVLAVGAGDLLVLLGYGVIFFVFRANTYAASTVKVRRGQKVISTGLYAFLRHPMYAGAFVLLVGQPLALGSLWGLLPVAGLCAVIVVRLLEEEKFLVKKLPGYRAYCRKTRYRLVPGLW